MTKRRRLTLRGGVPRLERTLLTEQTSAIDVGAWLDEYNEHARVRGRLLPYVILAQIVEEIAPITLTDPTPLIDLARQAKQPSPPERVIT
jgi:hypothetical protein